MGCYMRFYFLILISWALMLFRNLSPKEESGIISHMTLGLIFLSISHMPTPGSMEKLVVSLTAFVTMAKASSLWDSSSRLSLTL